MDFYAILEEIEKGRTYNPYANKDSQENWSEGTISIDFLNSNFGLYETATEMKNATDSEGLKRFFDYLVQEGKLPQ